MKSFRNDVPNLSGNTHVRSKIYREVSQWRTLC